MALDQAVLKNKIITNLQNAGFGTSNEFSQMPVFAEAIAEAVVTHIKESAEVTTALSTGTVK